MVILRCEVFDDEIKDENSNNYEENLSNIIVEYLLLKEYFAQHNPKNITLSDDKLTIRTSGPILNTSYGGIKIPSTKETKHHWIFKIIKTGSFMGIGIDETKYARIDKSFFDHSADSKIYGFCSDGDVTHWRKGHYGKGSPQYRNGDTVEMILDLKNKCIYIRVNEQEKILVVDDVTIGDDIEYCMAVSLKFYQNSVKLWII